MRLRIDGLGISITPQLNGQVQHSRVEEESRANLKRGQPGYYFMLGGGRQGSGWRKSLILLEGIIRQRISIFEITIAENAIIFL